MAGMREILRWLKAGHCILVFPSGSAATFSPKDGRIIDDPWQENISSLIRKTGATVVPMHISGHTGVFFQIVSMISRGLPANFLPREILRDGRMRHSIKLGSPVLPSSFDGKTDSELSDYLRLRSMLLRYEEPPRSPSAKQPSSTPSVPIDKSEDTEILREEVRHLPADCLCYASDSSPLCVYAATADQIPHLLHEIGVQRERSFRLVGEGTGTACDLDRWDQHYVHLFMWDREEGRFAGAYRIGRTDQILRSPGGAKGIYNAAFFHFSRKFLRKLSCGLEMGRAFITPEYQRLPASLDTLWMGIGRYLNKHPKYRFLYGTVSISQNYSFASRSLILSYLQTQCMNEELAKEVRANFPPTNLGLFSEDARLIPSALPDARALSAMVSDLEGGNSGIPVLLKQYLRLGGRMVSFGIDNDFGGVLDCLVVVDVQETPERIRRRYQGKDFTEVSPPSFS